MKSWKTTVCGVVTVAAGAVAVAPGMDPVIAKTAGVIAAIATGLIGIFARDNNKTSEDVKAGPRPPGQ
jgi:hypothetical protein